MWRFERSDSHAVLICCTRKRNFPVSHSESNYTRCRISSIHLSVGHLTYPWNVNINPNPNTMEKVNLNTLELTEFTGKHNPDQHCRATFPLFGANGTQSTATVYFELDAGDTLGRHTDSAEEILVILEGTVEAEIGEEKGSLTEGEIALVPKMVPHNLSNIGKGKARVLGIFGGANHIVATFDNVWMPVDSNTVDTSKMAG